MRQYSIVKSLIVSLMVMLLGYASISITHANSALIEEEDEFGTFAFAPIYDTDIGVISEHLVFDFRENTGHSWRAPISKTTARYQFVNSGDTKVVKMGFPFVYPNLTSMFENEFDPTMQVKQGETNLESTVYFGDVIYHDPTELQEVTFEAILETIKMSPDEMDLEVKGMLYHFSAEDSSVQLQLSLGANQRAIFDGFQSQETYIHQDTYMVHFFRTLGWTRNYSVYVIGEGESSIVMQTHDITIEEMSYHEYIEFRMNQQQIPSFYYPLIAELFVQNLTNHYQRVWNLNFYDFIYYPRIIMMVYDVQMEGNGAITDVEVEYFMSGSWSNRYRPPIYDYYYLTNPAKNYAYFQDFVIDLYLPISASYLIESTLNWDMLEVGRYQYNGIGLPDENIHFQISSSMDPQLQRYSGLMVFVILVLSAPVFIVGVGVTFVVVLINKNKRQSQRINRGSRR